MIISSKVFMELIERMTIMELRLKRFEERVETLEKRPIMVDTTEELNGKRQPSIEDIYNELMNGVRDEKLGRVKLTDGTD